MNSVVLCVTRQLTRPCLPGDQHIVRPDGRARRRRFAEVARDQRTGLKLAISGRSSLPAGRRHRRRMAHPSLERSGSSTRSRACADRSLEANERLWNASPRHQSARAMVRFARSALSRAPSTRRCPARTRYDRSGSSGSSPPAEPRAVHDRMRSWQPAVAFGCQAPAPWYRAMHPSACVRARPRSLGVQPAVANRQEPIDATAEMKAIDAAAREPPPSR